ncbi:hypothetical protein [Natronobacterium gregoryi]|uniref:Uncharacterized protein n=2 Tax=Natronobacterium gregoryi TaxID=44930 RepID=L0ALI1_NATGS|nr:hypothetical protein [Natronobacterium gregoryi]AFZ74626.1 hypothetical protein Natgr_3507 [Natronobacterium gregoryi SP2]SFJ30761.1 hypothetical protein SAMN05443661_12144 [Natronobacterium gregoryi]
MSSVDADDIGNKVTFTYATGGFAVLGSYQAAASSDVGLLPIVLGYPLILVAGLWFTHYIFEDVVNEVSDDEC